MASGWHKFTGKSPYPEMASNPQRSSFAYGVKNDRKYRLPWLQSRDSNNDQEVIKFVARTVNVPEPKIPVGEWLKDGVILCKLLDKMVPGSVPINTKRSQMSSNQNIQNFLHKCRELGFEENQLFEVSDLVDQKNIGKVLNCLTHLREEILTRNKLQFYI